MLLSHFSTVKHTSVWFRWNLFVLAGTLRLLHDGSELLKICISALVFLWQTFDSSMGSRSQGYFYHQQQQHHRSSVVPAAIPRLLHENGSLLGGIAQITPTLFLSRGNVASNRSLLLSKGITCVVNATIELPNFNWPHMEYVKVPLADMPHSPISLYFDSVADKIHSVGRKRGAVLVHCAAGVSRSASLCLAYLMKYHRVSLAEAHAWVKARRPVIRPNGGFWRQLIDYERKLFGKNSVKMVQTPYGVIPDIYERDRRSLAPYWGLWRVLLDRWKCALVGNSTPEFRCIQTANRNQIPTSMLQPPPFSLRWRQDPLNRPEVMSDTLGRQTAQGAEVGAICLWYPAKLRPGSDSDVTVVLSWPDVMWWFLCQFRSSLLCEGQHAWNLW